MTNESSLRNLVMKLGIGRYQAQTVIPNLFQAPAVTDPKSPHSILVVQHLQDALNEMGAGLARTGYLDADTSDALDRVVGPQWERQPWSSVIAHVLAAKNAPGAYAAADRSRAAPLPQNVTFAGLPFDLPDVPGGIVTYAVGAYLLWRHLKKRKG